MCKVLVVYYSLYGHIYKMAQAVAEGVRDCGAYCLEAEGIEPSSHIVEPPPHARMRRPNGTGATAMMFCLG